MDNWSAYIGAIVCIGEIFHTCEAFEAFDDVTGEEPPDSLVWENRDGIGGLRRVRDTKYMLTHARRALILCAVSVVILPFSIRNGIPPYICCLIVLAPIVAAIVQASVRLKNWE